MSLLSHIIYLDTQTAVSLQHTTTYKQSQTADMQVALYVLLGVLCALAVDRPLYEKGHFFIKEKMNWSAAQQYCRKHYTDLSIHANKWEYDELLKQDKRNRTSWIGLHFVDHSWKWTDGENISFEKWADSQPDVDGKCAYIYKEEWFAEQCEAKHNFICFKWMRKLILVRENKTWEDALIHCRSHHTDLASLQNTLKLQIGKNISSEAQTPHVWTSLRFLAGEWLWVDHNPEVKRNYKINLPQCPIQPLLCGAFNRTVPTSDFFPFTFTNRDCHEKLNYICYKKL